MSSFRRGTRPLAALVAVAATASAAAPTLTDAQAKKFFNDNGCNACHGADEFRIGPSYRAVALRYADASSETVDWLAAKVVNGGAGSWGVVPMIGNPAIAREDARAIARWILQLSDSSAPR